MARAMNVGKRADAVDYILKRAVVHGLRARKIASELTSTFCDKKGPAARHALQLARSAAKLANALDRLVQSF